MGCAFVRRDEWSSKMEVSSKEGVFIFFFFFLSNKIYIYTVLIVSMRLIEHKMLESICTVSVVANAIHMYYCNYTRCRLRLRGDERQDSGGIDNLGRDPPPPSGSRMNVVLCSGVR